MVRRLPVLHIRRIGHTMLAHVGCCWGFRLDKSNLHVIVQLEVILKSEGRDKKAGKSGKLDFYLLLDSNLTT